MPARDIFHAAVGNALHRDNWIVTDDPLFLRMGEEPFYIDFAKVIVTWHE